jgi:WD40 repeat protein
MQRLASRWQPVREHLCYRPPDHEIVGRAKVRICNMLHMGVLGAIVSILIIAVKILNPEAGEMSALTPPRASELGIRFTSLTLSPGADRMAATDAAGHLSLRSLENDMSVERSLEFSGFARVAAFSPDRRFLAAGGIARGVAVWDLESPTSHAPNTIAPQILRAMRMAFSPDGQSLAVTTDLDGTIVLWDLDANRESMVLRHRSPVTSLAFSPDGRWLATGGRGDRSTELWDLETGERGVQLETGSGAVSALAFSPDGTLVASATYFDHHVALWETNTWHKRFVFDGHARPVSSIAFSPDGSLLATAGGDGVVRLWSPAAGRQRASLRGHGLCRLTVGFSPDGRTLVLATADEGLVHSWDVADLLAANHRHGTRRVPTAR